MVALFWLSVGVAMVDSGRRVAAHSQPEGAEDMVIEGEIASRAQRLAHKKLPIERLKALLWKRGNAQKQKLDHEPDGGKDAGGANLWTGRKLNLEAYLADEASEFDVLDADSDGLLSREEHDGLVLNDGDDREQVFELRDVDPRDGKISRQEWLDFSRRNHGYPENSIHRPEFDGDTDHSSRLAPKTDDERAEHEASVRHEFEAADVDGDGQLSLAEVTQMILADDMGKEHLSHHERNSKSFKMRAIEDARHVITDHDLDKNGQISTEEYLQLHLADDAESPHAIYRELLRQMHEAEETLHGFDTLDAHT